MSDADDILHIIYDKAYEAVLTGRLLYGQGNVQFKIDPETLEVTAEPISNADLYVSLEEWGKT